MTDGIKISVIIPVYNSEKYLEKCLDSVIGQSMKTIEIIIVNDGSTDHSSEIIQNYAKQYANIISIDQPNSGQGFARNHALDYASGEYIAFVDSDDYIESGMFETLYIEATTNQLDVVLFNWDKVDYQGHVLEKSDHSEYDNRIFTRDEIVRGFLSEFQTVIEGFSWNKFIKADLFKRSRIRYPNLKFEDIPTMFHLLLKVKKCKYINQHLYHYVSHGNSTVHSMDKKNIEEFVAAIQMMETILDEEKMKSLFITDYFIYKSNQLLREYGRSYEVIRTSLHLDRLFKEQLKQVTIFKCLFNFPKKDIKLIVKLIFYKIGLLPLFISLYHKIRPTY
ncbi:glycosyltransferase [Sporolactobacillus inulinus]|uniref:Family 2 glycosyl transferase n=1 Tax=Sporolactobacillus inulinus CASD TaxID=1069536 RepID=A0A0U1QQC7_9BACL|nr:glycosyltransferase [Sporolactobacillus inulinus]KLI02994.1 family 2 glycosyl transferase [Sporolactobacillus inulinus CASD]GEB77516.1 hypothetical protein SIN01_18610 [Sporolactobacillus inulinus]